MRYVCMYEKCYNGGTAKALAKFTLKADTTTPHLHAYNVL